MQPIEFPHAGERLKGTLFIPEHGEAPFPGVVFFHGMTSSEKSYLPMAQALSERGVAALTINIRGHGGSSGIIEKLTEEDLETDGIAAFDFFSKLDNLDSSRLGICGGSFGALLATIITEARDVKSVVLRAPAAYTEEMRHKKMSEIIKGETQIFYDIMQEIDQTPAIKVIKKFKGSVFVVESEFDNIIPHEMSRAYYDNAIAASRRKFEMIKDAEHSLQNDEVRARFTSRIVEWFLSTL